MKIINLIHIGDEVRNIAEMSLEEKNEMSLKLNIQALEPLGYQLRNQEETNKTRGN